MTKDRTLRIHHRLVAVVGGFFGGYSVLTNFDVFGNAQTASLISLALAIAGRNPMEVGLRLLGLACYVLGTAMVVVMNHTHRRWTKTGSILLTMAMAIVTAFMPREWPVVIHLYPLFLAMSYQWSAFPGAYGYASSTIFSTNNVKQTTISTVEFLYTKNKKDLHRAEFFLGTLLSFHLGVLASYFAVQWLGQKASLLLLIYLAGVLCIVFKKE